MFQNKFDNQTPEEKLLFRKIHNLILLQKGILNKKLNLHMKIPIQNPS